MPRKRTYTSNRVYFPSDFGDEELIRKYQWQKDDAKLYFTSCIKPRLDRAYKLYIAYTGDRSKEIKKWQANVAVPYTHGVIETLMPRILDARPDFMVQGRNEDDQMKASKQQKLMDYQWEMAGMDAQSELATRAALIYGTGYFQVGWKKDVRTHKVLKSKDLAKRRLAWEEKEMTFFDGPMAMWVDNYSLWYDWHNVERENKQYWFRRRLMTGYEIDRVYPMADEERLAIALSRQSGDLTDYGSVRNEVKLVHERITRGSDFIVSSIYDVSGGTTAHNQYGNDPLLRIHEVFEWWRPFEDAYTVMVNDVPILPRGYIPIPFNFKEAPFIDIPFLRLPNEFEGYGLPMILESPQIMLNMIKNQRLDNATLSIHKMWIVNPLANVKNEELVVRPFGIIYSPDPNGVREVQFSDIKSSAYQEEKLLKEDMRYASGVDDFSMGVAGAAGSATEVRHLRESTLERVRLFINHLGDAYARIMRYWMSMTSQFFTDKLTIRIIGDNGKEEFPLIEKDDLMGEFDYKAMVIPSIAGMNEVKKKQDMDLFQLFAAAGLPFIDLKKLVAKMLYDWNWDPESIMKPEEQALIPGMMPGTEETENTIQPMTEETVGLPMSPTMGAGEIPSEVVQAIIANLGGARTPFSQAAAPINLLEAGGMPPTAPALPLQTTNPRGFNRTGRVNTNISMGGNATPEGSLMNRTFNLQR